MKTLWKIFAGLMLLVIALTLWLCQVAGMPVRFLYLDSFIVVQAVEIFLVLGLILIAVLPNGRGQLSGLLKAMLWFELGFSILASLYGLMSVQAGMAATHTTNLRVIAPGLAESLVPLAIGLLIATVAAWKVASARKPSPAPTFD